MQHPRLDTKRMWLLRTKVFPGRLFLWSLFVFMVVCLSGAVWADSSPILLGMSAGFTGSTQSVSTELYRGSMAYFRQINEQGGVKGHPLRIVPKNDFYDPDPAIQNTIEFISKEHVLCLMNYVGTPTVTRILPLLNVFNTSHTLLFFPFSGAQPQRDMPYMPYVYNLRASYRQETSAIIDKFVQLGKHRIAVFFQADAYGRSGWDGVRRALHTYGLDIVAEATYARGATIEDSMLNQVEILRNGEPDAIVSIGAAPACAAFIRDARNAGLDVPIANVSFVGSESLLQDLLVCQHKSGQDYTEKLINTQVVPSYEDMTLSAVVNYRNAMDALGDVWPKGLAPEDKSSFRYSFASFEGYLNAVVMTEILRRMDDPLDRSKMIHAIKSLTGLDIGIGVPVGFGENSNQGLNVVFFTTVKNGLFVPIGDWSVLDH